MEVTNRFKGLDLINRVYEELWTKVHGIVQEAEMKTIPKKTKCKKAKEPLQIAQKRREAKGKGEKERYTHLNAEFKRISRKDKKVIPLHIASFVVQTLLSFIRSHLFIFAFISNILGGSCCDLCRRVFCLCSPLGVL